jgi:Vinculin Binding Site
MVVRTTSLFRSMVTGGASMLTDKTRGGARHCLLACDDVYGPRSLRFIVLNENEAATKGDLAAMAADLTAKMASKEDLAAMAAELTADLTAKMASKEDLAALAADLTMKMASKEDLAALAADLTADLTMKMASKEDLAKLAAATKEDLAAMEKRLLRELGHVVNVVIEQIGAKIAVIDDKYDGPMRQVRADLDAHRADFSLHTRPAPSAPKRTSRRKPLRAR